MCTGGGGVAGLVCFDDDELFWSVEVSIQTANAAYLSPLVPILFGLVEVSVGNCNLLIILD